MNFLGIDDIRTEGFEGFVPISTLQASGCGEVPKLPGIYLVLKSNGTAPMFCDQSRGGHFKGKDPRIDVGTLEQRWIDNTIVLYIGKAGPRAATLRSRLKAYMRFGQGYKVGHWGGRCIWQLRHSGDLIICWKAVLDALPRTVEAGLLKEFEGQYHRLPFANLNH
jgi:hypothetical protein